jgi:hypothetical protein
VNKSARRRPLIALLRGPDLVRDDILATFGDDEIKAVKAAVRWGWDHRRVRNLTQSFASAQIGVKPSHFANILNGKKYLPPERLNAYEWIVGNRAVSLTIDRFRRIREEQSALELARAIVAAGGRK